MLSLSRKRNEALRIGKQGEIIIKVLEIRGTQVRLGVEAPREVPIYREEVWTEMINEEGR